jgi:PAS domain S-box-containing protein
MYVNPNTLIAIINLCILGGFIILGWQQRQILATRLFVYLCIAASIANAIGLLQGMTNDVSTITWLERLSHLPWQAITVIAPFFMKAFVGQPEWITRRRLIRIAIVPALFSLLVLSPAYIPLVWTNLSMAQHEGFTSIAFIYNTGSPVLLMAFAYISGIIVYCASIIFSATRSKNKNTRRQAWLLLAALGSLFVMVAIELIAGGLGYSLYIVGLGITLTTIPVGYGLMRYRFLNLAPRAYNIAIANMRDAVFVLDNQQAIIEVNPAAERMAKIPHLELIGKDSRRVFAELVDDNTAWQTIDRSEFAFTGKADGQHYNVVISPVNDNNDNRHGFVIVIRNVSHLKQLEQQAVELALANQRAHMLRTLLTDVAHDLRTPLTVLHTSTHIMTRMSDGLRQSVAKAQWMTEDETVLPQLDTMHDQSIAIQERADQVKMSARRLNALLDSMFEMAKLDSLEEMVMTVSDLNQIISGTLELLRGTARQRNILLDFIPDATIHAVHLNAAYFSRAIQNLVENALRYTPDGGTICVETYGEHRQVCVIVRDSGAGIASEDLPHIFDRFYRGDKARNIENGGMGLGLSIVSKVVAAHNGTITVESTPGNGTTFRIILPTLNGILIASPANP